jgi:hypothetical protein
MKTELIASLVLCLLGAIPACWAQETATGDYTAPPTATPKSEQATWDRLLFPKNSLRGFTEGGYFPSHNEAVAQVGQARTVEPTPHAPHSAAISWADTWNSSPSGGS